MGPPSPPRGESSSCITFPHEEFNLQKIPLPLKVKYPRKFQPFWRFILDNFPGASPNIKLIYQRENEANKKNFVQEFWKFPPCKICPGKFIPGNFLSLGKFHPVEQTPFAHPLQKIPLPHKISVYFLKQMLTMDRFHTLLPFLHGL